MSKIFKSLITVAGREKIGAAIVSGDKVVFSQMSVGDGGGSATTPDENQTSLINERFLTQLNSLKLSDTENIIIAEMIIPPEVGGFTIREAALFDDAGVCMAVANVPETYKPALTEGSGRFTILRIWLAVSSTEAVELVVDPGIVLATVEDVINAGNEIKDYTDEQLSEHAGSRDHPDATLEEKGFTQLSNAINSDSQERAATPLAVKLAVESAIRSAWELDNPVGTVRLYAQNINPNETYPWSKWVYTGEHTTIRIGKADGSDVGSDGGQDEITLTEEHLPTHKHRVKGKTKSFNFEQIETEDAGEHDHEFPLTGDASNTGMADGGDPAKQDGAQRTSKQPAHRHAVNIPDHEHEIDFDSESAGEGKSFSIVEAHTLLMCWARVA
ncbi:phage tail protein [Klebsiella aerogenes]|uniref:phage tail protein n=1 Tax=Klebsiella aerogenes TaxID=548 RepID=UPI0033609958